MEQKGEQEGEQQGEWILRHGALPHPWGPHTSMGPTRQCVNCGMRYEAQVKGDDGERGAAEQGDTRENDRVWPTHTHTV